MPDSRAHMTLPDIERGVLQAFEQHCALLHWPGFRAWVYAEVIWPRTQQAARAALALWFEDMVPDDEHDASLLGLIDLVLTQWVPAWRVARARGEPFGLYRDRATPLLETAVALRTRESEVAGFLDGLLNRDTNIPADPQADDAVRALEEVEDILGALAIVAGHRISTVILLQLETFIEQEITAIAARLD